MVRIASKGLQPIGNCRFRSGYALSQFFPVKLKQSFLEVHLPFWVPNAFVRFRFFRKLHGYTRFPFFPSEGNLCGLNLLAAIPVTAPSFSSTLSSRTSSFAIFFTSSTGICSKCVLAFRIAIPLSAGSNSSRRGALRVILLGGRNFF